MPWKECAIITESRTESVYTMVDCRSGETGEVERRSDCARVLCGVFFEMNNNLIIQKKRFT